MAGTTLAYLYQLQNGSYQTLSSTDFKIAVIDPDSAGLSNSQIDSLQGAGKNVIAYLSIGEAEDYRGYWQSSWNSSPPSFVLGENPNWPGNYEVKFWDPAWQKIIMDRAVSLAQAGYNGLTLDVVDVYQVSEVANAYTGSSDPRTEMMKFVGKIADATRAINPDFKIIQNNALDLLTVNPDDPSSATNSSYLSKIDAVNAETTFYNHNNTKTSWGAWNIQYLDHAVSAGKEVFAIDYPTSSSAQQDFITKAIDHHYVPFVADPGLSKILPVNYQILDSLPPHALDDIIGSTGSSGGGGTPTPDPVPVGSIIKGTNSSETLTGTAGDDTIYGYNGTNTINGGSGNDTLYGGIHKDIMTGGAGDDHLYGGGATNNRFVFGTGSGHDVIHDFKNPGGSTGDIIDISHAIYATRSKVMSHVTYSGNDAIVHLDGDNTITVAGVGHNLTANDFHIT